MTKLWKRIQTAIGAIPARSRSQLNVSFFGSWFRDYEQFKERMPGSSKRTLSGKQ